MDEQGDRMTVSQWDLPGGGAALRAIAGLYCRSGLVIVEVFREGCYGLKRSKPHLMRTITACSHIQQQLAQLCIPDA